MLSGGLSKSKIGIGIKPLVAAGPAAHSAYCSATQRGDQLVGRPEFARSQLASFGIALDVEIQHGNLLGGLGKTPRRSLNWQDYAKLIAALSAARR